MVLLQVVGVLGEYDDWDNAEESLEHRYRKALLQAEQCVMTTL